MWKQRQSYYQIGLLFFTLLAVVWLNGWASAAPGSSQLIRGQVILERIELDTTSLKISSNEGRTRLNQIDTYPRAYKPGEYIVKFNKNLPEDYINHTLLRNRGKVIKQLASNNTYKILVSESESTVISSLKKSQLVSYIAPNYLVHIQGYPVPDDPGYSSQWNLEMLNLRQVWAALPDRRDVTVAVVDTGILPHHPDLEGNLTAGYDFVDNDGDPTDTDPNFSHGTHVAGIIAAISDNGVGVVGIDPLVKIMPVRVIGPGGSGGYDALISGINWAVDHGADIINLSLAGPVDMPALHEAVKRAVDSGVTVVAAAGNNNTTPILYPARYPEVISVGAVGPDGKRAYYSNYGPGLDLVAPGGDSSSSISPNAILSTAGYMGSDGEIDQYTFSQGTSMAAPHVSGMAALLYSSGKTDPREILKLLTSTADDLGATGRDDHYGAGLVNINRALGLEDTDDNHPSGPGQPAGITTSGLNNHNRLLGMVRISAVHHKNGGRTEQLTTMVSDEGKFSLRLTPGSWSITGWADLDGNQQVSTGDYLGNLENLQVGVSRAPHTIKLKMARIK